MGQAVEITNLDYSAADLRRLASREKRGEVVRHRQSRAIKTFDFDFGVRAHQNIHTLNGDIGTLTQDQGVNSSVAATDVKHGGITGQHFAKLLGQHPRATLEHHVAMNLIDQTGHQMLLAPRPTH